MAFDVNKFAEDVSGDVVGGVVIVYTGTEHKEAARVNPEGEWIVADEFKVEVAEAPAKKVVNKKAAE